MNEGLGTRRSFSFWLARPFDEWVNVRPPTDEKLRLDGRLSWPLGPRFFFIRDLGARWGKGMKIGAIAENLMERVAVANLAPRPLVETQIALPPCARSRRVPSLASSRPLTLGRRVPTGLPHPARPIPRLRRSVSIAWSASAMPAGETANIECRPSTANGCCATARAASSPGVAPRAGRRRPLRDLGLPACVGTGRGRRHARSDGSLFRITSASGTWSVEEIKGWQRAAGLAPRKPILLQSIRGWAALPAERPQ